jgi:uncharacterized protein (DUF433 family)
MELPERITIHKDVMGGKPCIKGTRIAVRTLLGFMAAGEPVERILAAYPQLSHADIQGCLQFAAQFIDEHSELAIAV